MYNFGFAVENQAAVASFQQGVAQVPQSEINLNWLPQTEGRRPFGNLTQQVRKQPLDALFYEAERTLFPTSRLLQTVPTLISLDSVPLRSFSTPVTNTNKTDKLLHQTRRFLQLERLSKQTETLQLAAGFVVWSEWAKRELVKNYAVAPQKIAVVRGGIDLDGWDTALTTFNTTQPKDVELPERVRLLFVGNDFSELGGDLLLEVLKNDPELARRYELHFVLNHATATRLGASLKRHHVHIHTHSQMRGEGAELYLNADIFVLPARQATNPALLATALASGLPIIASRVEGLTELVKDGTNGLLIEPNNVASLATAINTLVNDPAQRTAMGTASRTLAETEFNPVTNTHQILTFLKQITATARQQHIQTPPIQKLGHNFGTLATAPVSIIQPSKHYIHDKVV